MTADAVFYARPPDHARLDLQISPRLASWNKSGHPDQVRLADFLRHASSLIGRPSSRLEDPLVLDLDVALPESVPLLKEYDLDNYLYPLASYVTRSVGRPLASAWCSKRHGETSSIALDDALVLDVTPPGRYVVRTTASGSTTAYKQQIRDQLGDVPMLPPGPVGLQIAFVVGPRRNWLNLWKPTIDALDAMLGRTRSDRDWHPLDGRIVELGLHCVVDGLMNNDVGLEIFGFGFQTDDAGTT